MQNSQDPIVLPRETISTDKSLQVAVRTMDGASLVMTLNIQLMQEIMRSMRNEAIELEYGEQTSACA